MRRIVSRSPRRLAAVAWAAIALSAAAACGEATGPADELREARTRWRSTRPAAYAYTLQVGCFCLPEVTTPVIVEVRGTTVQSRRYEATGESVDPRWAETFPSIDGLFDRIEAAAAGGAEYIDAEYDRARGYPRTLFIDYRSGMADDEVSYVVRDWRPL